MIVDCRTELVAAMKYEGDKAIETSFSVVGEVAMRGIMGDPEVAKNLQSLPTYMDTSKLEKLGKDVAEKR